jgi:hypothetical protein
LNRIGSLVITHNCHCERTLRSNLCAGEIASSQNALLAMTPWDMGNPQIGFGLTSADFPRVLQEFRRVLQPTGRLVLINMTRPAHWYDGFWEWVYQVSPNSMTGCRGVVLSEALRANGFQSIEREYLSQLGFPSEILTAHV